MNPVPDLLVTVTASCTTPDHIVTTRETVDMDGFTPDLFQALTERLTRRIAKHQGTTTATTVWTALVEPVGGLPGRRLDPPVAA